MDPYSAVPSAPPDDDDENEDSIQLGQLQQPSYMMSKHLRTYDDDDEDDDDVNKPIKPDISAASFHNIYASAPDPSVASSAAGGDYPEFEKLGPLQTTQETDKLNTSNHEPFDDEDEGFGHSTFGQRMDYTNAAYQDVLFLVLWLLHLTAMFVILIYQWSNKKMIILREASAGFFIVFVCAIIGAVLGYIWTKVIRKYSGRIIKLMLFGNLLFLSIATLLHFLLLQMLTAILCLVVTVIFALYMWSIWRRIPFTEILIDISCQIINQYPLIVVTSLFILICQILWILWWSAIAVAYLSHYQWSNAVLFLLLVSFYWNLEVFKNVGHTTVCGVAATWFFSPMTVHQPTLKSLKRALTTSLGSIVLGSLIVAVISALRQLVLAVKDKSKHNIVRCLLDCILACLQRMVQYFNMYAFCHCAVYGTNYIQSAQQTWSLLKTKGIDALINDDLTGFCILCGSLIGGIICAIVGGILGRFGTDAPQTYALFGFLVGFYLCLTILQTVTSCVITIFVCYAEDPHAMSMNHPSEYNKVEKARAGLGHTIESNAQSAV